MISLLDVAVALSHCRSVALTHSSICVLLCLQVNTNGFVSMAIPPEESEYLGKMPTGPGIIAVLLGDLDTSDSIGKVYFRQDTSPDVLQKIAEQIGQAFPGEDEVEPTHALIVTWENVAARGASERGDGVNKQASTSAENQGCCSNTFSVHLCILLKVF